MSTNPVGWLYGLRLIGETEYRYIGITTQGVSVRLAQHLKAARYPTKKTNYPVYHWIRKHGEENIVADTLSEHASLGKLSAAEVEMIAGLRATSSQLLNLSAGGAIFRQTPEMREKIRQSKLGKPNPGAAIAGRNRIPDQATRDKMSASSRLRWASEDQRKRASDLRQGHPKGSHAQKLDEGMAMEIRRRRNAGENGAALGREFGVSRTMIYVIAKGGAWK